MPVKLAAADRTATARWSLTHQPPVNVPGAGAITSLEDLGTGPSGLANSPALHGLAGANGYGEDPLTGDTIVNPGTTSKIASSISTIQKGDRQVRRRDGESLRGARGRYLWGDGLVRSANTGAGSFSKMGVCRGRRGCGAGRDHGGQ